MKDFFWEKLHNFIGRHYVSIKIGHVYRIEDSKCRGYSSLKWPLYTAHSHSKPQEVFGEVTDDKTIHLEKQFQREEPRLQKRRRPRRRRDLSLFVLLLGLSQQESWSGLPFPPPELFTMTVHLEWPCAAWLIASLSYTSPSPWQGCDPWRDRCCEANKQYHGVLLHKETNRSETEKTVCVCIVIYGAGVSQSWGKVHFCPPGYRIWWMRVYQVCTCTM